MKDKDRYFECENCGQVVQGWHAAMEWINCCDNQQMVEITAEVSTLQSWAEWKEANPSVKVVGLELSDDEITERIHEIAKEFIASHDLSKAEFDELETLLK